MLKCLNERISQIYQKKSSLTTEQIILKLPKPILDKLLECIGDKKVATRQIHQSIYREFTKIFNLSSKDIIAIIDSRLYIRFALPAQSNSSSDRRFNGESAEFLESLYNECFDESKNSELYSALESILDEILNFNYIDNATFTALFIPSFRIAVESVILNNIKSEYVDKIEGFGGFVLRKHFSGFLLYCAKNLLDKIEKQNKNAIEFIKHYTDDVVMDQTGAKIQRHPIIDANNQKWNYIAINSIMLQYKQSKDKIIAQKTLADQSRLAIKSYKNSITDELEKQKLSTQEIESIELEIAALDMQILESSDKEIMRELNSKQRELKWLKQTKTSELKLYDEKIENIKSEISIVSSRFTNEQKSLQVLMSQSKPIHEKYELITKALSQVLAKR